MVHRNYRKALLFYFITLLIATFYSILPTLAEAPKNYLKSKFYSSVKDHFLVATEKMTDDRFKKTVIVMLDNDEEGAWGLVINKPIGKVPLRFLVNKAQDTTAEEIWRDTDGKITHFVSAMGTTGTIMGVSRYLKSKNPKIQIIGTQPDAESHIPGIRRWPEGYLPTIFDATWVDSMMDVNQITAEQTTRELATKEGIFAGVSSGGADRKSVV